MTNQDATSSEPIGEERCPDCGAWGLRVSTGPKNRTATAGPDYVIYSCPHCDRRWEKTITPSSTGGKI